MNKQIIKLYEQAQDEVVDSDCADYYERIQLKFARLIVQECINRINDLKGYTGLNDLQQIVSTVCWNTALNSSVHEIKKHFGVEE